MVYDGYDETSEYVKRYIVENGPFDVLLGFSQGAAAAAQLALRAENEFYLPSTLMWRCVVCFSGFIPRDTQMTTEWNTHALKAPSIHVFGSNDDVVLPAGSVALRDRCVNSELLEFDGNHTVPRRIHGNGKQTVLSVLRRLETACAPLLAFDFDGVLCDSAGETGTSGYVTLRRLLPGLDLDERPTAELVEAFRSVRPLLETGFEAVLLMHELLRGESPTTSARAMVEGGRVDFDAMFEEKPFNAFTKDQLKAEFAQTRRTWIEEDEDEWLGLNGFYDFAVRGTNARFLDYFERDFSTHFCIFQSSNASYTRVRAKYS